QPGETLLETLERSGYRPDFSCRAGACATCRLRVLSGSVHASDENNALTPAERAQGYVLSCVAEPEGDVTLATAGRQVAPARSFSAGGKAHPPVARIAARRGLRVAVATAAIGIFASAWGLTHNAATAPTPTTAGSSSSGAATSGSSGSSNGSSNGSNGSSSAGSGSAVNGGSGSSNSAGSIFTLPNPGGSNSSTGTS
ncbi:MAG TPA: 2Fe-2S iron-sulfur cluster-binding protein, partial [Ktedonobacterales bacterium]